MFLVQGTNIQWSWSSSITYS